MAVSEDLYKTSRGDHFLRDKTDPFMYGIDQKLPILEEPWQQLKNSMVKQMIKNGMTVTG